MYAVYMHTRIYALAYPASCQFVAASLIDSNAVDSMCNDQACFLLRVWTVLYLQACKFHTCSAKRCSRQTLVIAPLKSGSTVRDWKIIANPAVRDYTKANTMKQRCAANLGRYNMHMNQFVCSHLKVVICVIPAFELFNPTTFNTSTA